MTMLSGETFIAGPVTSFSWDTIGTYSGPAGIVSLTDPALGNVPEPSSLLLSGVGLAALLYLFGKLKVRPANN
jgi:hypothetical protein